MSLFILIVSCKFVAIHGTVCWVQHAVCGHVYHPYCCLTEAVPGPRRVSQPDAHSPICSLGASDGISMCHPSSSVEFISVG